MNLDEYASNARIALEGWVPPEASSAACLQLSRSRRQRRRTMIGAAAFAGVVAVGGALWSVTGAETVDVRAVASDAAVPTRCPFVGASDTYDVAVYVLPGASDRDVADLRRGVAADRAVTRFDYLDESASWERFTSLFRDRPDITTALEPDDLPTVLVVMLENSASTADFIARWTSAPGVFAANEIPCEPAEVEPGASGVTVPR